MGLLGCGCYFANQTAAPYKCRRLASLHLPDAEKDFLPDVVKKDLEMDLLKLLFPRVADALQLRRRHKSRIRHFQRLLWLSDVNLAALNVTRAEIRNRLARLHIGRAATTSR